MNTHSLILEIGHLAPFVSNPTLQQFGDDPFKNILVYSHPQVWPNTACGFKGIAGQAFTTAQTHVLLKHDSSLAAVYHNNKFAYWVTKPSEKFFKALKSHYLAGAEDLEFVNKNYCGK